LVHLLRLPEESALDVPLLCLALDLSRGIPGTAIADAKFSVWQCAAVFGI
jgi:hypothetical protein